MTKKVVSLHKQKSAVPPEDRQQLGRVDGEALLSDLRSLIQTARQRLATAANSTHTLLCWQVGRRLLRENLQEGRAAYGKQILATLSQELPDVFGRGFGYTTGNRAIQSAQVSTDPAIVSTLSTQLSWSHFIEPLPIKVPMPLLRAQERACEITGGAAA